MDETERESIKHACAEVGVEYAEDKHGEPLLMCMQQLEDKIAIRAFRALIPLVANSGNQQLNADFDMLMRVYARNSKLAAQQEYDEIQAELSTRWARANRKQKVSCPYSAEQYDAAVKKVGTKQQALAAELRVDRKTLSKYGRPDPA